MKDVLVRKSDQGEISVYDRTDKFMASFKDGHWVNDVVFQFSELEEFTIIENDEEVISILAEARAALGKPFC